MLPAPATMAATPATRSKVSWNPAVPPPPVTGAAVGTGLTVEVTVAVGVGVCVTVRVARGVTVEGELELTPGVPEAEVVLLPAEGEVPGLPAEAEAETDTEPLTVTDGEKVGTVGAVVDDPEVHAASATGASRVSAPQHRTVSFPPSVVPRTFIFFAAWTPRSTGQGENAAPPLGVSCSRIRI
jgi:hypothetical protein